MNDEQMTRIRASFDALTHRTPELADRFHTRLFAQNPALRPLMPRDLSQQKQDFAAGLRMLVRNLHRLDAFQLTVMDIGARQSRLGVTPGHYGIAREVLIVTMREMAGPVWTDELTVDWNEALSSIVSLMVVGAARARAHAA